MRCAVSHFERPAKPRAAARKTGGQVVGRPSQIRNALGVFSDRPLVALPGLQRRGDIGFSLQVNRKRQCIHHRTAAALADIGRQRMRGIAKKSNVSGRPAFEFDQLEAIITALRADAINQSRQRRKLDEELLKAL